MTSAKHRAPEHSASPDDCVVCGAPPPREFQLLAALDRTERALADIEALHILGDYGTCKCCAWPWPCGTLRASQAGQT